MERLVELVFGADSPWAQIIARGLVVTVELAAVTLPIGLCAGLAVAFLTARRGAGPLAKLCSLLMILVRSVPEMLTILMVYYGVQMLLQRYVDERIQISPFWAGVFALLLVLAAFSSQVFVAALRNVPPGEVEAGQALGLSTFALQFGVVMPHVLRLSLPALGNLWLIIIKDTALVSVIALQDLMRASSIAASSTKQYSTFFLVACALYLMLSSLSGVLFRTFEKRLGRGFIRSF